MADEKIIEIVVRATNDSSSGLSEAEAGVEALAAKQNTLASSATAATAANKGLSSASYDVGASLESIAQSAAASALRLQQIAEASAAAGGGIRGIVPAANAATGAFDSMGASLERLAARALSYLAFREIVNVLRDGISEAIEFEHSMIALSSSTGIAEGQLAALSGAMSAAGENTSTLSMGVRRFASSMLAARNPSSEQAEALRELGITSTDFMGALGQLAGHLETSTKFTQDSANVTKIFGRNTVELVDFLREAGTQFPQFIGLHQQLAAAVDKAVPATKEYQRAAAGLHEELRILALEAIPLATDGMKFLSGALATGEAGFKVLAAYAQATWESIGIGATAYSKQVSEALHGDVAGVIATHQKAIADIGLAWDTAAGKALSTYVNLQQKLVSIYDTPKQKTTPKTGGGEIDPAGPRAKTQEIELQGQERHQAEVLQLERTAIEARQKLDSTYYAEGQAALIASVNAELAVHQDFIAKRMALYSGGKDPQSKEEIARLGNARVEAEDKAARELEGIYDRGLEAAKRRGEKEIQIQELALTAEGAMEVARIEAQKKAIETRLKMDSSYLSESQAALLRAEAAEISAIQSTLDKKIALYANDPDSAEKIARLNAEKSAASNEGQKKIQAIVDSNAEAKARVAEDNRKANLIIEENELEHQARMLTIQQGQSVAFAKMTHGSESTVVGIYSHYGALIDQLRQKIQALQDQAESPNGAHSQTKDAQLSGKQQKGNDDAYGKQIEQADAALKAMSAKFDKTFGAINNSFEGAFEKWASGTKSFSQAFGKSIDQMGAHLISSLAMWGVKFAEMELKKVIIHAAASQQQVIVTQVAEGQKAAIESEGALKSLAKSAVTAAGKAYSAVVGIPIVGPILAPIAAGAAFAGVMAFSAISAEGGAILGPSPSMAFLHPREMVLPARESGFIQKMAGQDNGGAGQGDTHVHFHVSAIDAKGVDDFFKDNRGQLRKHIAGLRKDGVNV